jgi:hypothetical protein
MATAIPAAASAVVAAVMIAVILLTLGMRLIVKGGNVCRVNA